MLIGLPVGLPTSRFAPEPLPLVLPRSPSGKMNELPTWLSGGTKSINFFCRRIASEAAPSEPPPPATVSAETSAGNAAAVPPRVNRSGEVEMIIDENGCGPISGLWLVDRVSNLGAHANSYEIEVRRV